MQGKRAYRISSLIVVLAMAVGSWAMFPAGATARDAKSPRQRCTDRSNVARLLTLTVKGQKATGRYALPSKKPTGLAVFGHGYGHTSASWAEHMKRAAKRGVIAVTMDYRGLKISPDTDKDGLPESRGWNAMAGAEDLIAAAQWFENACSSIKKIVLMGVSMGGNMSGLALALSKDVKRSDGKPLFDYWIDVEGAVNVSETYHEARLVAQSGNAYAKKAQADIEAEMGGTFEEKPEAYRDRTVVARIQDIKASGVRGVVVIHGIDDGLVPYNQAREMATLLGGSEIPTHLFTIGRRSAKSERETTLTGYAGGQLDPNYTSPFAGHASEKSTTHIVMVTAFEQLWQLFDKPAIEGYEESVVDGPTGTYPQE